MSNYLDKAIEEEKGQKYLNAINFYEKAILNKEATSEVFINLSFLYWKIAAEFTFRDKFRIPDSLASIYADKYKEVLTAGLAFYPNNSEMIFWSKYFPHRLLYDDFSFEEALEIVNRTADKNLVPYFYLYLFDSKKYKIERDLLLKECYQLQIAKNLHIISLIEK